MGDLLSQCYVLLIPDKMEKTYNSLINQVLSPHTDKAKGSLRSADKVQFSKKDNNKIADGKNVQTGHCIQGYMNPRNEVGVVLLY